MEKFEGLSTIRQVAAHMKVNVSTVRGWVRSGKITSYGYGRIHRLDLNEVLLSLRQNANYPGVHDGSLKTRLSFKHSRN